MCPPHVHKLSKHLHTFSSCFTNKLKYLNSRPRFLKKCVKSANPTKCLLLFIFLHISSYSLTLTKFSYHQNHKVFNQVDEKCWHHYTTP